MDDLVAIHAWKALSSAKADDGDVLVTTVTGMSEAELGARYLQCIFPELSVISGGTGGLQLLGDDDDDPALPPWLIQHRRDLHQLVTAQYGRVPSLHDTTSTESPSFEKLYDFLQDSPNNSVTLLCLGPLSNIAQWQMHQGALLQEKVNEIWILGGNDPVADSNSKQKPEFNFARDIIATKQVLEGKQLANKIRLVLGCDTSFETLPHVVDDVKEQVLIAWRQHPSDFYCRLLYSHPEASCFDPICTFVMEHHPAMAQLQSHNVTVCEETGLLLLQPDGGHNSIKIVCNINIDTGYLPWIRKSLLL